VLLERDCPALVQATAAASYVCADFRAHARLERRPIADELEIGRASQRPFENSIPRSGDPAAECLHAHIRPIDERE
jgi:hypothetical protein